MRKMKGITKINEDTLKINLRTPYGQYSNLFVNSVQQKDKRRKEIISRIRAIHKDRVMLDREERDLCLELGKLDIDLDKDKKL